VFDEPLGLAAAMGVGYGLLYALAYAIFAALIMLSVALLHALLGGSGSSTEGMSAAALFIGQGPEGWLFVLALVADVALSVVTLRACAQKAAAVQSQALRIAAGLDVPPPGTATTTAATTAAAGGEPGRPSRNQNDRDLLWWRDDDIPPPASTRASTSRSPSPGTLTPPSTVKTTGLARALLIVCAIEALLLLVSILRAHFGTPTNALEWLLHWSAVPLLFLLLPIVARSYLLLRPSPATPAPRRPT
jgi:hypothetical protein